VAKNIKKCLLFPEWALNSRAYISFSSLSEEGEPKDEKPFSAICFFSGNRKKETAIPALCHRKNHKIPSIP